ncbi:MAG TPA: bifunctional 5,10-methylenetetrahydrofolate dehydrogenase/5,10-methenyltetrahydrofolate cyclohydrolase [Thermoanaerobaculia bacterium]|nr:bifunctional 5,10-methylenetetrahydrofolate dehydrogenase/5,10-methenyltetrahydrofolate cyclohydrolase [Thermoanaerobaculia bacterium]
MTAAIIDGRGVADEVLLLLAPRIEQLRLRGITPGLVALRVGDDPASEIYVRLKARKAEEIGLRGIQKHLPSSISRQELLSEIRSLNQDDAVDGILLQLPLPAHLDAKEILDAIDPRKDVDGFHPLNVGKLHQGRPSLLPCTPAGVIRLIESTGTDLRGKRAVVVGRSDIVGKPAAALLLRKDATVTLAHSKSTDLAAIVREAEILVAAAGRACMVTADMIRPGAIVIDVGINRVDKDSPQASRIRDPRKLELLETKGFAVVGDVEYHGAREVASWITPVPFGVGPMTIAMLMANTVQSAEERRG